MTRTRPTPTPFAALAALLTLAFSSPPALASTLGARLEASARGGKPRAPARSPGAHARFGVTGTAHDLTSSGASAYRTADTTEVCVFCHTPHGGGGQGLWNRKGDASGLTLYGDGARGTAQVGPETLFCLSCHDGTMAFDQLSTGPSGEALASGARQGWRFEGGASLSPGAVSNLGRDLRDDHPVSVTYDPQRSPDLRPATLATVGGLPLFGPARDQLECSSCHDPHDDRQGLFLRASNRGSQLCLTCHQK